MSWNKVKTALMIAVFAALMITKAACKSQMGEGAEKLPNPRS